MQTALLTEYSWCVRVQLCRSVASDLSTMSDDDRLPVTSAPDTSGLQDETNCGAQDDSCLAGMTLLSPSIVVQCPAGAPPSPPAPPPPPTPPAVPAPPPPALAPLTGPRSPLNSAPGGGRARNLSQTRRLQWYKISALAVKTAPADNIWASIGRTLSDGGTPIDVTNLRQMFSTAPAHHTPSATEQNNLDSCQTLGRKTDEVRACTLLRASKGTPGDAKLVTEILGS